MVYTKTTWQNNVTDIDANNLNKIEQGIYDNSLVVDAITNTINPRDTETYKTAELTEGQITDVIGVNNILIKGQTSQNGEPTPSSPVDVNVVSGSNIVYTSNKNLLDISALTTRTKANVNITNNGDGSFTLNGTSSSNGGAVDIPINIPLKDNTTYTYSKTTKTNVAVFAIILFNSSYQTIVSLDSGSTSTSFTPQSDVVVKYFRLYFAPNKTFTNHTIYPMLEINSTATPFTEHQDKELPLDLPVENLLDISKLSLISNNNYLSSGTNKISVKPNTTYTFKVKESTGTDGSIKLYDSNNNNTSNYSQTSSSKNLITFTTGENDSYLIIQKWYIGVQGITNVSEVEPQLEQGSKANTYTPYGTDPIELCKIGNYQDYFYKSGSKWYSHKEIGKVALEGNENWTADSNGQRAYSSVIADNVLRPTTNDIVLIGLCDKLPVLSFTDVYINKRDGLSISTSGTLSVHIAGVTDIPFNENDFNIWISQLSNHNITLYYALATATDTEITDTTLKSQLEAIYNAPLYEQTNITQTNNDLPMVLDITACKDNVNGIKAFIRK